MKMPSIEERREVARRLRDFEQLRAAFKESSTCAFSDALGVGYMDWEHICARLADLIDPTAHERTVADNLALIERNRELGCELAACKAKLGRVFRIAARLRGDHRMAVLRAGDGTVPRSVADGFEIAEEIAATLQMTPRVTACEVGGAEWE
jgi:hypothetical protein